LESAGESIASARRPRGGRRRICVPSPLGSERKSFQSFAWGRDHRRPSLPVQASTPSGPFSTDLINELLTGPDRRTIAGNRGKTWAAGSSGAGSFFRRLDPILNEWRAPAPAPTEDRVMTARTSFKGSFTALVTPFKNGSLDEEAFRGLVDRQIAEGTTGLVPVGTTGESPTLSHAEHERVVEWCIDQARGRAPVIAGAGSNSTAEAIEFSQAAEKAGADAVLIVTPYYNKPTQEGLYQHFKAINDAIGIPIIIYNIPPRSVIDMSVDTMTRLFELKNIAGVKDATASMVRVSQQRQAMGPGFNQLSGEDATALGFMAHGGHGCISVTANVAPRLCAEFQGACLKGDYATALKLQDKLMPLHHALFIETNPAPAKYALSVLGKCAETVRLPMVPVAEKTRTAVREAMVHAGLIN
jgi:4-hydroxy-tetrahydrodipicolinate synthase